MNTSKFTRPFINTAATLIIATCATLFASLIFAAPDGTIDLTLYKAGFIVGGSGGSGTLKFKGKQYPVDIGGVSLGATIGVSKAELIGDLTDEAIDRLAEQLVVRFDALRSLANLQPQVLQSDAESLVSSILGAVGVFVIERDFVKASAFAFAGREVIVPRGELENRLARGDSRAGSWALEALRTAAAVPRLGLRVLSRDREPDHAVDHHLARHRAGIPVAG